MKHLLVLASLVCALSSQTAVAGGKKAPMFSIQYGSVGAGPSKTIVLESNAGWQIQSYDAKGKLVTTKGKFDRKVYEQVRDAIVLAPWTVTQSSVTCSAEPMSYATYSMHGKVLFTDQMCSGATVDPLTLRSIATIESALGLR